MFFKYISVDRDSSIKRRLDLWGDWGMMTFKLASTLATMALLKMQSTQISNVKADLD